MTGTPAPPADQHLSIGAYLLHALPAAEAQAFEAHLAGCESCTEEVGGLRAAAAMLGAAEALRPPAALRENVLTAAARTPQERPLPGRDPGPGPHRHSTGRGWYRRPAGWLAAAAAVLVIGGGVSWAVLAGRTAPMTASQRMEQCVSADASSATMTPSVGAGGSLIRSDSCDAVVVKLPAMPAPPTGMAYQLWMIKGDAPRSMGLVPSLDGAMMPMPIRAGDSAVAVTVEPAAGSDQPTGRPIWAVPLH